MDIKKDLLELISIQDSITHLNENTPPILPLWVAELLDQKQFEMLKEERERMTVGSIKGMQALISQRDALVRRITREVEYLEERHYEEQVS